MQRILLLWAILVSLIAAEWRGMPRARAETKREDPSAIPKPVSHTIRDLEGWKVRVDDRLLSGEGEPIGRHALRILSNRLHDIQQTLPPDKTARLRQVPIWIDQSHGALKSAQYHPSAGWLERNGYDTNLVKGVHIPVASEFSSAGHQQVQPWSVLHELAHAYHDQELDFDHAEIRAAWERWRENGSRANSLHIRGHLTRHYGLTDQKEFFAEMTEAFFGVNDFFPFNRAELRREEPALFELLERIWIKDSVPSYAALKRLPLPGQVWTVEGRPAFLILPPNQIPGRTIPWVWYAPTLAGLPGKEEIWMFDRFLAAGIAVAGVDAGESFGSPRGRELFSAFYNDAIRREGLSKKPVLLARSRGGLMLMNWAVENPESVGGIAGIYPVLNLLSYPGVEQARGAYELTAEQLLENLGSHNPIARLERLAPALPPMFFIHGDIDAVVPLEQNSGEAARRYREMGGQVELVIPEGQGHNMWPGFFECQPLVDFVIQFGRKGAARHD